MAIPTRYREALTSRAEGELIVTVDRECLLIYPKPEWEEFELKLMAVPNFNPVARRLQRLLMGYAKDMRMDPQGRVLLPKELREVANLEEGKKAVLLGQGNKFELWNKELWGVRTDEWRAVEYGEGLDLPAELASFSL